MMNFEEVKQMFKKSIDNADTMNQTIENLIQSIYLKGYNDALKYEQKTGKWIVDESETNLYGRGTRIWACHCPECGKDPQEEYIEGTENWWLSKLPNFCPNCGAKLEGESE